MEDFDLEHVLIRNDTFACYTEIINTRFKYKAYLFFKQMFCLFLI